MAKKNTKKQSINPLAVGIAGAVAVAAAGTAAAVFLTSKNGEKAIIKSIEEVKEVRKSLTKGKKVLSPRKKDRNNQ